jgi:outer membrane protein
MLIPTAQQRIGQRMPRTGERQSGLLRLAAVAIITYLAGHLVAGDAQAQTAPQAIVDLRGGIAFSPSYLGSDDYELGPEAALRFNYIRLPGWISFGAADGFGAPLGFGLRGSARYLPSRRPGDAAALDGTDRVDGALELGLGLGYQGEDWRAFGVLRYGVIGHNAFVGEAGADAIFQPSDSLTITAGPRAHWGSDRFMDTYFGVSPDEADNSPLEAFSPSSGLYAVGVEVGARYQFSDRWGVEGAATYDRLIDDAADSPIAQTGSRDQFGLRLGLTRTIRLGF